MKRAAVIALDIGATSIKAAVLDTEGNFLAKASAPTQGAAGPERVLDNAAALAGQLSRGLAPKAIGVSSCGMIDPRRSTVVYATSVMPGWAGTNIAAGLKARTGLRCAARNDGDCAALGEALYGAGKGAAVFAMYTLGTGVGGGITIKGRLLDGENCAAGRLGHVKVHPGGRLCACGARGCLEAYASAYACRAALEMEPKQAFALAAKGDKAGEAFVHAAANALGLAFADLANTLNPGVIAVGGGMAAGWRLMKAGIMETFAANALPQACGSIRIVPAVTGNDAGLLGAFALVSKKF